jgi:SPP1 gp7 family putative phage head morphogenesis protein
MNNVKLPNGSPPSWSDVQRLYRNQTNDIIRSAVTTMYEISARKTVERDIKRPFFLTQQDMNEIRRYTQKYQEWWWLALNREVVKKMLTTYDPLTFLLLVPSKLKLKDTFIGRMTESLHGEVAADAVISKARQVALNVQHTRTMRQNYSPGFRRASLFRSAQSLGGEPHLVWRTAEDEATCEICAPLQGHVYAIDDPSVIRPVEDTHYRCRCELELVDASETQEIETIADLYAAELF